MKSVDLVLDAFILHHTIDDGSDSRNFLDFLDDEEGFVKFESLFHDNDSNILAPPHCSFAISEECLNDFIDSERFEAMPFIEAILGSVLLHEKWFEILLSLRAFFSKFSKGAFLFLENEYSNIVSQAKLYEEVCTEALMFFADFFVKEQCELYQKTVFGDNYIASILLFDKEFFKDFLYYPNGYEDIAFDSKKDDFSIDALRKFFFALPEFLFKVRGKNQFSQYCIYLYHFVSKSFGVAATHENKKDALKLWSLRQQLAFLYMLVFEMPISNIKAKAIKSAFKLDSEFFRLVSENKDFDVLLRKHNETYRGLRLFL